MTLEELITQANSLGLRINNLCQLHNGRWQANLTDGERFWEFGRGENAIQALLAALHKHATTEPEMGRKQPPAQTYTRTTRANTTQEIAEALKDF